MKLSPDTIDLPFSPACERNKGPILKALKSTLLGEQMLLEVGSGTGQHGEYFARHLPRVIWQTTDQEHNLLNLTERVSRADLANLLLPFRLDVNDHSWLCETDAKVCLYDAVFTANTLHIMDVDSVENFFRGLPLNAKTKAQLIIYGPFRYNGRFTSESNAEFDQSLRSRGVGSAIREIEWIESLAAQGGFVLKADLEMPANNQCLLFERASLCSN